MNILITGASRGIGFKTALELSKNSHNKVIAFSRNQAGLNELKDLSNGAIDICTVDLELDDLEPLNSFLSAYNNIDVLINNAGQLINKKFIDLSINEWRKLFEANFFTAVKLTSFMLPLLKRSAHPHILNIGSMGGFQGTSKFVGLSAYSASKAALGNLTECLAEELKEFNIRVNCLALGAVNTEMLKDAFPSYKAPVESDDIARFIADFSLNSHHFINGKIIPVSVSTP